MSEECGHNCSECSVDCDSREQQSFLVKPNEKSRIKHVYGIVSGKGGVGKSLVTSLLAAGMKKRGYSVGILDADITGPSIPKMFGTDIPASPAEDGIMPSTSEGGIKFISINSLLPNASDPVVWRGPVIASVVKQFWQDVIWGDVDFMFVDMPPGTGDVPLTVFQSLPIEGVIVVASPQELVGMIVGKAVKMAEMMKVPVVGLVENMAYFECPDCGTKHYIFGQTDIEELAVRFGIGTKAQMPIDPKIAKLCDESKVEEIEGNWLEPILEKIQAAGEKE